MGPLCVGKQVPGEEHDTGAMWECPFFVPLPADASSGAAALPGRSLRPCSMTSPCLCCKCHTICNVTHSSLVFLVSNLCQSKGDMQ